MTEPPSPINALGTRIKQIPRGALIAAGIFGLMVMIIIGGGWWYQGQYHERIYPGVMVGQIAVGGLARAQAQEILQRTVVELERQPLRFLVNGQELSVPIAPTDPDAGVPLIRFEASPSADLAFEIGHHGGGITQWVDRLAALIGQRQLAWAVQVDRPRLRAALRVASARLPGQESPGQDARVVLTKTVAGYQATVTPGSRGIIFNYDAVIDAIIAQTAMGAFDVLPLVLIEHDPTVTTAMAQAVATTAPAAMARGPLTLQFDEQSWELTVDELAAMFAAVPTADLTAAEPGLDPELFDAYLTAKVAPTVDRPLQNAKFTMSNGRVTEFVAAQSGRTINRVQLGQLISEQFFVAGQSAVDIPVTEVQPVASESDVNDLGIAELLGVGKSSFAGSPKNRRHNIATGAAALNGLVIKPGEEFSLLKALGEIDAANGYLPELVIKGDRTIPEYGGGLCQIGTTMFRATLDSGLPVTVRQNHSYRVSYYEPAGTDATIYNPAPDYRFLNDTGVAILIQTKIIGDELRFEFWGKKDGRTMWYEGQQASANFYDIKPKIYNQVSPPPTKLIESVDIPVGTKKCTERAHVGATTDFTYQIKYPDGKTYEKQFTSYYRPWQEVCLIGVEKLTEIPPPADDATPTDPAAIPVTPPADQPI